MAQSEDLGGLLSTAQWPKGGKGEFRAKIVGFVISQT